MRQNEWLMRPEMKHRTRMWIPCTEWKMACFFHVSAPVSALHWWGPAGRNNVRPVCRTKNKHPVWTLVVALESAIIGIRSTLCNFQKWREKVFLTSSTNCLICEAHCLDSGLRRETTAANGQVVRWECSSDPQEDEILLNSLPTNERHRTMKRLRSPLPASYHLTFTLDCITSNMSHQKVLCISCLSGHVPCEPHLTSA